MKNLKKKALMAGSYVAVAALAVGGTLAYLTDSDKDTNVMTLGKVQIEQHEYERALNEDGSYKTDTIDEKTSYVLKEFTQNKPLLPIVGDPNEPSSSPAYAGWDDTTVRMSQVDSYGGMQVFAGKNAQDKFVTVENTGRTDAYVRTLVAIEIGSSDGSKIMTSSRAKTANAPWNYRAVGNVAIDDSTYVVMEFTYCGAPDVNRHVGGILPAGDTTYPSLCQVYLKHNTTNEDIEKIDGNGNGLLDIRVLSQAVQVDGFDDAATALDAGFGAANEENVKAWFANMKGVNATPESGATRPAGYVPEGSDVVISGLTVVDNSDDATNLRALTNVDDAVVNGDLTVANSYLDGTYAMNVYGDDTGVLTVKNSTLKGWISYDGFIAAEFNNCTFAENTNPELYKTIRPYSNIVISNSSFEAGYEFWLDKLPTGATITFDNCTIDGVAITSATQLKTPMGNAEAIVIK